MEFLLILDLLGCAVFALSGAIIAFQQRMDGIGVLVLAAATAIGGGTIRDLLLDVPVFWLTQTSYIYTILVASIVAIVWLNSTKNIPERSLEFADALGLALFVVMGTQKALDAGVPEVTAVIMGMMTGCFGGVIRDVLANQIPLILRKELYAACCLLGGIVYVSMISLFDPLVSGLCSFFTVFLLRLAALKWKLSIPVFNYTQVDKVD